MKLPRVIPAIASVCLSVALAHAQTGSITNTQGLTGLINGQFPDNTVGAITPFNLRQVTLDMANSTPIPCVNKQTGTTYTIQASDYGCLITFTQGTTVTLPAAASLFPFVATVSNLGMGGKLSVVPASGLINLTTSITVATGSGVAIYSDGTNYEVFNGSATSVANGGNTGTPGGLPTQVQYNATGTFAGTSGLTVSGTAITAMKLNQTILTNTSGNGSYAATLVGGVVGCAQFDASGNIGGTGTNCGNAGATSPGNPTTSVQYNNAGAFAGAGGFTISNGGQTLTGPDTATWITSGITGLTSLTMTTGSKCINWGSQLLHLCQSTGITLQEGNVSFFTFQDANGAGGAAQGIFGAAGHGGAVSIDDGTGHLGTFTNATIGGNGGPIVYLGGGISSTNGNLQLTSLSASSVITLPDTGSLGTSFNSFNNPMLFNANVSTPIGSGPGTGIMEIAADNGTGTFWIGGGGTGVRNLPLTSSPVFSFTNQGYIGLNYQSGFSARTITLGLGEAYYACSVNFGCDGVAAHNNLLAQIYGADFVGMGSIASFGTVTSGSGCTPGPYPYVSLVSGTGGDAIAQVYVTAGGGATSISISTWDRNLPVVAGWFFRVGEKLGVPHSAVPCTVQPTVQIGSVWPYTAGQPTYMAQLGNLGVIQGWGQYAPFWGDNTIFFGATAGAAQSPATWCVVSDGCNLDVQTNGTFRLGRGLVGPANQSVCEVRMGDNLGTLAVTTCGGIAFLTITNPGSGGTPGTYSGVTLTIASASNQAFGNGAVANVTVGAGGTVTTATIANAGAGLGYIPGGGTNPARVFPGEQLTVASPGIGNTVGLQLEVLTLTATDAPISALNQTLSGTATSTVGKVGLGATTATVGSCGSLAGAAGCLIISVGGVQRNVPFY